MAHTDPAADLGAMALLALVVAFSSATQDVAIDAWRIEAVEPELQGAMAATYQLGYRVALLVSGGGALILADRIPWSATYAAMAALTLVGMATVLLIREPDRPADPGTAAREARMAAGLAAAGAPGWLRRLGAWFAGRLRRPVADFFARHGALALAILAFVALFRVSDVLMGAMANPFYLDTGFSKTEIGAVAKIGGTFATILGALLGGVLVARLGLFPPLLAAALLLPLTNLLFAVLSFVGPGTVDARRRYLRRQSQRRFRRPRCSSPTCPGLTSLAYTATQYALFSSLMTLPGKFLAGFSGVVVDAHGYAALFVGTAAAGIPAVLLAVFLGRRSGLRAAAAGGETRDR